MAEKLRVQFEFSPDALNRLDQMKEKADVSTRVEMVRKALRMYEWFLSLDPEKTIELRRPDGVIVYLSSIESFLSL